MNKNGAVGDGNSQLIEVLPARFAGTRTDEPKKFTIQVALDGKHFLESPSVVLRVDNTGIREETEYAFTDKEDIRTVTVNYKEEGTGKALAKPDKYEAYAISMVQQFDIAPKSIPGYEVVKNKAGEPVISPAVKWDKDLIGDAGRNYTYTYRRLKPATVKVKKVKVTGSYKKVAAGKKVKLTAAVSPSNATNKAVTWKSSNTNIATVSNTGLVTGKSKGQVQITATANGTTCICNVNVIAPRVTVSMSNASIYAAGSRSSFTLTATVNGTNKDAVTWSSSNTGVARVTNGVVQGTGAGNATITASFAGSKATCSVNVMRQTISMSGGNPIYAKGTGSSTQLTATVNGTVGNDAVAWTSGNTNIAKVSGGKVTGVGAGTVTITATSNGVSTSKSIQVKEPTIKLDRETANIYPPATKTVTFTVTVNGVQGNSGVTWRSGNTKVATVSNGKVTAVGKGTATITAKANGKLAKAKVTVKDPYANVSPTSGTIKVGKTLQLTTNYAPASTGTPSYSSSNKKVATVDSKGVVKGVKAGTATITVKVNGVTAKAEITVK